MDDGQSRGKCESRRQRGTITAEVCLTLFYRCVSSLPLCLLALSWMPSSSATTIYRSRQTSNRVPVNRHQVCGVRPLGDIFYRCPTPSRRIKPSMSFRSLLRAGTSALAGLALLPSASSATMLYVASYAGTVTTLNLTTTPSGQPSLESVASSTGCAPNPSWLTLDKATSTLYCLNEGLDTRNGSLASLQTLPNGDLTLRSTTTTPSGPVSGVVYGSDGSGIALAE